MFINYFIYCEKEVEFIIVESPVFHSLFQLLILHPASRSKRSTCHHPKPTARGRTRKALQTENILVSCLLFTAPSRSSEFG